MHRSIRDPEMAVPWKKENIQFPVLRRIRKQKERTTSQKKKQQIAIEFLVTVLLFGLFMYENLNPITVQWLLENSTSFSYSILKLKNNQNCRESAKIAWKNVGFPYFSQKFGRFFLSPRGLIKVPKEVLLLSLLFSWNKGEYAHMHNVGGTCAEILPSFSQLGVFRLVGS